MKRLLNRFFTKSTITDITVDPNTLTVMLNEPLPDGADVLAWYAKNIPANDY